MTEKIPDHEAYLCPTCSGSGGDPEPCNTCHGTGQINKRKCTNCCSKLERGSDTLWNVASIECCWWCAMAYVEEMA